jgi:F-type H+-transporting ATPase subunit a
MCRHFVEFVQKQLKTRHFKQAANIATVASIGVAGGQAFAGEGIPHVIDYYGMVAESLGLAEHWVPTIGALFITLLLIGLGLRYRASVAAAGDDALPVSKLSVRFIVESVMDMLYGLGRDNCGENFRAYLPLLSTLFIFILTCNLTGLIPGFDPPTISMDTNLAMGLIVFIVYNYAGLKEHGGGYVKHFLGPVAFIAPLFFIIELISHASRPMSLGLRLMGNIYGDHTLLGVFTGLCKFVPVPAFLMFFGLLVAVVQSYVFTLLTGIYISLAISHDH